jgi:hypothetical protein
MPSSKYHSTIGLIRQNLNALQREAVQKAKINAKETKILLSVSDCVSAYASCGKVDGRVTVSGCNSGARFLCVRNRTTPSLHNNASFHDATMTCSVLFCLFSLVYRNAIFFTSWLRNVFTSLSHYELLYFLFPTLYSGLGGGGDRYVGILCIGDIR